MSTIEPQKNAIPVLHGAQTGVDPVSKPVFLTVASLIVPVVLAYSFGRINEQQILAVVIGLIGVGAIIAQPFCGLILFTVLLYARPEESIPALAGMHFTLLVAVVALLGMVLQFMLHRTPTVRTPFFGMALGFAIVGIISAISIGNVDAAIQDFARIVVLVVLILNLVRTSDRYQTLVTTILICTGYLAIYSVYLFQTGQALLQDGQFRTKATGIFSDPNDLAATFVAGVGLVITRIMQTKRVACGSHIALLIVFMYAILLTNSRGGMLALIVVAIGYFVVAKVSKFTKIAIALCAVALLLGVGGRMTNFDSSESSANSRFWFWSNGINMLISHPTFGVGYAQFVPNNGGMTAHNSFVLCFAELGLVGYFFWIGCIYYGYRKRQDAESDVSLSIQQAQTLFGARIGLAAYLAASFWLSHTYHPIMILFLCLPIVAQNRADSACTIRLCDNARRWQEWRHIAMISIASILIIDLIAIRGR